MSQPEAVTAPRPNTSLLVRGAIWIAIGALIAAALVCVVWVLIGNQDGLIGRAFLTILLLAAFAGIAILEAGLAPNRPDWLAVTSMITWIIALLVGAVKIWLPEEPGYYNTGAERFFQLLLVVGILQLAMLHVRLFRPAAERYVTVFTRVIYYLTIVFLVALVGMLVFFLTFPDTFRYDDLYWRIVVALAILAAVGTTLIPLLNALFAPKKERPAHAVAAQPWPTYADGRTPLQVMPDGSPDWNAYYTGYPTMQAPGVLPAPAYSQQQGHMLAPVIASTPEPPAASSHPVWPADDSTPIAETPAVEPPAPAVPPAPPAPAESPQQPAHAEPPVTEPPAQPEPPVRAGQPARPVHDTAPPPPAPPVPPIPPAPQP